MSESGNRTALANRRPRRLLESLAKRMVYRATAWLFLLFPVAVTASVKANGADWATALGVGLPVGLVAALFLNLRIGNLHRWSGAPIAWKEDGLQPAAMSQRDTADNSNWLLQLAGAVLGLVAIIGLFFFAFSGRFWPSLLAGVIGAAILLGIPIFLIWLVARLFGVGKR